METFKLTSEIFLDILLIIYILSNIRPPEAIANLIDTSLGKLLIFCIILYLFVKKHFILAILSLWAFYDLMRKSAAITGNDALKQWLPTEKKKFSELSLYNQFPYTLEQEVVSKMTTAPKGFSLTKYSWKPNLERSFSNSASVSSV